MINAKNVIIENSEVDETTKIWNNVIIFDSKIGARCSIGSFSEIGHTEIGNDTRLGCGCFTCIGVKIGNNCFISPHVCFASDKFPKVLNCKDYTGIEYHPPKDVIVKDSVIIGANATICPGVTLGENSFIGAGSVVTKDVPPNEIWCGNPAKFLRMNK
jgi:acetyltransferase-like isoleucine patch superfamily enzyme